jgi:proline iminopeptidase
MIRTTLASSAALLFASAADGQEAIARVQVREGHVVTADGVALFFQVRGTGRDTMVVLHGGPGFSSAYLAPDLDLLAGGYTLIHYDQRGAGRSDVITDSSRLRLHDHIADLERVRQHFGLSKLVLLGHSWGGGLAAQYARVHPDRVARLILVDPMPPRRTPYTEEIDRNVWAGMDSSTAARVQTLMVALDTASDAGSACRAFVGIFDRAYWADLAKRSRMRGDACNAPPAALRNFSTANLAVMRSLGNWDWRAELNNIHVPVLIIHGDRDPNPVASAEEWKAAFPRAQLVIVEGSGHYPHVEQPSAFKGAVDAFLRNPE